MKFDNNSLEKAMLLCKMKNFILHTGIGGEYETTSQNVTWGTEGLKKCHVLLEWLITHTTVAVAYYIETYCC